MRCTRLRAIRLIPFSSSISPTPFLSLNLSLSLSVSIYLSIYLYLYFSLAHKRRLYITWPRYRIAVLWERKSRALKTRSVSVRVTRSAAVDSYRSRKYARPSLSVLLFLLPIALSISLHFRLSARPVSLDLLCQSNYFVREIFECIAYTSAQRKWFLLNGLNYSRD